MVKKGMRVASRKTTPTRRCRYCLEVVKDGASGEYLHGDRERFYEYTELVDYTSLREDETFDSTDKDDQAFVQVFFYPSEFK